MQITKCYEWYDNIEIGYEFEFYLNDKYNFLVDIKRLLGVDIKVSNKYHSGLYYDECVWKLEKDFTGGDSMYELITYKYGYFKACDILSTVLELIKKYGYVNDKCGLHINISYKDIQILERIDLLKMIIEFDEEYVYRLFPERKNNIYTHSIKVLFPIDENITLNLNNINLNNFYYPDNKYFGINLEKLFKNKNYIEFRYIGGSKYIKKIEEINNFINYVGYFLYNLIDKKIDSDDIILLNNIINNNRWRFEIFKSYEKFRSLLPNVELLYDLKSDEHYYKNLWGHLSTLMKKYLLFLDLSSGGIINYDSDFRSIQLKNFVINNAYKLRGVGLFFCTINNCNYVSNCIIYGSKINNSIIKHSDISNSNINSSAVYNSYIADDCFINNSFLSSSKKENLMVLKSGNIKNTVVVINKNIVKKYE